MPAWSSQVATCVSLTLALEGEGGVASSCVRGKPLTCTYRGERGGKGPGLEFLRKSEELQPTGDLEPERERLTAVSSWSTTPEVLPDCVGCSFSEPAKSWVAQSGPQKEYLIFWPWDLSNPQLRSAAITKKQFFPEGGSTPPPDPP